MSEPSLETQVSLGLQAKALMESEMFQAALGSLQVAYTEELVKASITDIEKIQVAKMGLAALSDVRTRLRATIANGEHSASILTQQNARGESRGE